MENLERQIQLANQTPYRLAFKTGVAGMALSAGSGSTALRLCLEVLLINPEFLPANELMAINRITDNDLEMAILEFENILRIDPSSKFGNFGKTIMLCITGKQQEALNGLLEMTEDEQFAEVGHYLLQRLLGLAPDSYLQGSMFKKLAGTVLEGKTKTAHDLLTDIVKTTESPRLQIVLSDLLVTRSERKTAKRLLEQLSDTHPFFPDMLYRLAKLEIHEQNKPKAAELVKTLQETDPLYPDTDNIFGGQTSSFAIPQDIETVSELHKWCLDVLKRLGLSQKPVFTEPEPINTEPEPQEIEEPADQEPEYKLPELEEPPKVVRLETVDVPVEIPIEVKTIKPSSLDDEPPPDQATQEIQLSRTRKILEQARQILDQTRVEVDKQREEQLKQDLIAEAEADLKKQREIEENREEPYDGPTLFDAVTGEVSKPKPEPTQQQTHQVDDVSEIHPIDIIEEVETIPEMENAPRRIVLPTSDEAPQNTSERAWQLLRAGEAEEAFMMFSKLLRGDR